MTTPWSWQQFLEAVLPHTRALDRGDMPPKAPNDAASLIARQIQRETNKPDVPPPEDAT
jgi:hypothetical protein